MFPDILIWLKLLVQDTDHRMFEVSPILSLPGRYFGTIVLPWIYTVMYECMGNGITPLGCHKGFSTPIHEYIVNPHLLQTQLNGRL